MNWKIEFAEVARKQLKKLEPGTGKKIARFLYQEAALEQNPTRHPKAKALKGPLKGLWRFDIGDYRAICGISKASG